MSSQEPLGLVNKIKDMKAKPFIANSQVKQKWKYKYLYTWHIANVTRSPKYWIWTKLNKIFPDLLFANQTQGWVGLSTQNNPNFCKSTLNSVYFTQEHCTIRLSKKGLNYIYLCAPTKSATRSNGQWKYTQNSKRAVTCIINILKSQNQTIGLHFFNPKSYFFVSKNSMYTCTVSELFS